MKVAERAHGTRARYTMGVGPGITPGCRCEACTEANRLYRRRYIEGKGIDHTDPSGEAEKLLAELRDAGLSLHDIAAVTGLSYDGLKQLGRGIRKRVRASTLEKLQAAVAEYEENIS